MVVTLDPSSKPGDELAVARERLERSDLALRTVLDALPDAALLHRDGVVVHANPACLSLLAAGSAAAVVGQPLTRFVQTEPPVATEARLTSLDGAALRVAVSSVPLAFQGMPAVMLVLRDRTVPQHVDARLVLTDRMASMGLLAAGLAHEANNPLGYALANLDFALEELAAMEAELTSSSGDDEARTLGRLARGRAKVRSVVDSLREARHGADRVRHLIRDLKTFSRHDDERKGPVDVRRILDSAINMAHNELRTRAHLVKDYGPTPTVLANEARLGQVFLNLIVNAAQAIPEGDSERQRVRVSTATDERGRCVVEVSDTGQGIAPSDLLRIFDPFYTTKAGTGTGLGLAICQSIVTSKGGELTVKSEVGKGSTFRVTLPSTEEAVPDTPGPSSRTSLLAGRARVLVVDDEPMMARAVQRLLGGEHDIIATTDPKVAVDLVRSGKRFDAVLCDLMMPVMSGMDVYEAIARIDAAQARRFIFMTGGTFTERAEQFLERVGNPRLDKPLDRSALRAAVRSMS
jgi:signal transduction histidine kinase/CheY-like chemotaxis protein